MEEKNKIRLYSQPTDHILKNPIKIKMRTYKRNMKVPLLQKREIPKLLNLERDKVIF